MSDKLQQLAGRELIGEAGPATDDLESDGEDNHGREDVRPRPCHSYRSPSKVKPANLVLGSPLLRLEEKSDYAAGTMRIPLVTRKIEPRDVLGVRSLCLASFPIEYPDAWYEDVVSGTLTSIGIFEGERIVGLVVAEYKYLIYCNIEDRNILPEEATPVVYILSLAVDRDYRRMGLATKLLRTLLHFFSKENGYTDRFVPRAMFLHVLSTNSAAIKFYHHNGFTLHDTLLNYYRLRDGYGDGLTYVLYLNGGRRPFSWTDFCRHVTSFFCSPVTRLLKSGNNNYPD